MAGSVESMINMIRACAGKLSGKLPV